MYFGVAYYPEHWPDDRWPLDAKMMQAAGVNGVRMGEFAWSKFEPAPNEYDFAWFDRAVELLGKHGINTLMCTPSRTPPPWVFKEFPGIVNVRADRMPANYGFRYTICHNNPEFKAIAETIDRKVIEHFAGNRYVTAWHIDNEIGSGNTCYCPICHAKFKEYLSEKYRTVKRLNQCWGMHFWSLAYTDFDEVPLPSGAIIASPQLALEYARFISRSNAEFARWRYQLIKRLNPSTWVTTNFQTSRATHTDAFEMGKWTDVYGTNFYPQYGPEFALDYLRGARRDLIILEQGSGAPYFMNSYGPGWMRLWAYRSIAHGAVGINFFRWRTARWGQEEYWHGVLPHSGRPNRRYHELSQMGAEIQKISDLVDQTRPQAKAAVVLSYESRWALDAVSARGSIPDQFAAAPLDAHEEAKAYHGALMEMNVTTDAMDPREDLTQYSLVIAPRLYVVDDAIATNLQNFVAGGGVLCLTPRSGVADEYNVIFDRPAPGPLAEMAGVLVDDYARIDDPLPIQICFGEQESTILGEYWADEIELAGAEPVAVYREGWLKGMPAITIHEYGKGKVVYVGTLLRGANLQALARWLCAQAGVSPVLITPAGVHAYERRSEKIRLLFLINYGQETQSVALDGDYIDLLDGGQANEVQILPIDLKILQAS